MSNDQFEHFTTEDLKNIVVAYMKDVNTSLNKEQQETLVKLIEVERALTLREEQP